MRPFLSLRVQGGHAGRPPQPVGCSAWPCPTHPLRPASPGGEDGTVSGSPGPGLPPRAPPRLPPGRPVAGSWDAWRLGLSEDNDTPQQEKVCQPTARTRASSCFPYSRRDPPRKELRVRAGPAPPPGPSPRACALQGRRAGGSSGAPAPLLRALPRPGPRGPVSLHCGLCLSDRDSALPACSPITLHPSRPL